MFFAACLLITSTLPTPAPVPAAPADPTPPVAIEQSQAPQTQDPGGQPSHTTPPHRIGIGAQMNASTNGASGGTRYWFGDRLGVDLNAGWYRSSFTTVNNNRPSTFAVTPSAMYRFGKTNATDDMQVRPFVGAGVSYETTSGYSTSLQRTNLATRQSGMGEQAFAGLELTFKQYDSLAISAEGLYRHLPVGVLNTARDIGGFDWVLGLHYYIK
jgi:outer membrane protein W